MHAKNVHHGFYFPHIDGIRALAVLGVFIYHIIEPWCPGGFTGVDVFFVISGYLITGGILKDLDMKRFSVKRFYYRRIRRIMPAYFVMIIGVFALGAMVYFAAPLIQLSDAVVSGNLFVANIHFWLVGGDYFAPRLHTQPLLHLWSLSVEEQFYLVIPILCWAVWKINRRFVFPVLVLISGISLLASIYFVHTGRASDAFYLPHFRAWELLSGSLLAMVSPMAKLREGEADGTLEKTPLRPVVLSICGMVLVLGSYALLSPKSAFPGINAIPAVLGSVLLIKFGFAGPVYKLLAWKPMVGMGKISYSLYLWHWPIIVFWKYLRFDQVNGMDLLGMTVVSLIMGYLSWRYIEIPVRSSDFWTLKRTYAYSTTIAVVLLILGLLTSSNEGWRNQLNITANQWAGEPDPLATLTGKIESGLAGLDRKTASSMGVLGRVAERRKQEVLKWGGTGQSTIGSPESPTVFLVGDSHAAMLNYGLDQELRAVGLGAYSFTGGSAPMFDMKQSRSMDAIKKLSAMPQVRYVVLSQLWLGYASTPEEMDEMFIQLEEFATHVVSAGKTLFILEDIPNCRYRHHEYVARSHIIRPGKKVGEKTTQFQTPEDYTLMQGEINDRIRAVCSKTGAVAVPMHEALLADGVYTFFDRDSHGNPVPLYKDVNHLSPYGSLVAGRYLVDYLTKSEDGVLFP